MRDESRKHLKRRLRANLDPRERHLSEVWHASMSNSVLRILCLFLAGIILFFLKGMVSREEAENMEIAGILAFFLGGLYIIFAPILADWMRSWASRRWHEEHMCQCPWHQEKFEK